jgi:hypothetical protein
MTGTVVDRMGGSGDQRKTRMADINPIPSFFTMAPANRDHEVGIRCGITVLVPLLTLLLIDRIDLAIFASFGAFTAIYGRNLKHGPRLQMQVRAGSLMFVVLLLATLAGRNGLSEAENPWGLVGLTTIVAGACAVIAAYWNLRPSGSLFQIFAFAAVASVSHQPPLGEALLTAALTIVFAVVVGISSRVHPAHRHPFEWQAGERITAERHRIVWSEAAWYVVAAGVAGSLATALGPVLGMQHNYWAMVSAVVPLVGHSTRYRVNRGLQRIVGTFLGLVLLAVVLWLHPQLWAIVLIIAVLQCVAELFIARQYVLAQMTVTPLALLSTVLGMSASTDTIDTSGLLYDRFLETVIGSVVGMACVLAPWAWRKWVRHSADPTRITRR